MMRFRRAPALALAFAMAAACGVASHEDDGGPSRSVALDGAVDSPTPVADASDSGGDIANTTDAAALFVNRNAVALLSQSQLPPNVGGLPTRFNGANKIVRVGGSYFVLSPTLRVGEAEPSNMSVRVYRRAVDAAGGDWELVATLPDAASTDPCVFGPGETITRSCELQRIMTFTGTIVADPNGVLHVFEFAAVMVDGLSAEGRFVHFVSTAPASALGPLHFTPYVQPPTIHRGYPAGVVVAAHDDARGLFHMLYWGTPTGTSHANHDAEFVAASAGALTKDPYSDDDYRQETLMIASLPDGSSWLEHPSVLQEPTPVFYASSELPVDATFAGCSGTRVAMLRAHKYPFALVRGDELVVASVSNTESCINLTTGASCTTGQPCAQFPVQGRVTGPHVNWTFERFGITISGANVDYVKRGEGGILPTTRSAPDGGVAVGEALTCHAGIDLFDVVGDSSGNVFFAGYGSSEPISSGCQKTRERSISVLTSDNRFLARDLVVDWTKQNGLPCLAQTNRGVFWFLTGGADPSMIGHLDAVSFDGKHVTAAPLPEPTIAEPPFLTNSYFPQCVNDRSQRQSSDRALVVTTAVDESSPADVQSTLAIDVIDQTASVQRPVMGTIDGISSEMNGPVLTGWACERFGPAITVEIYAGGPKGTGALVGTYPTDQPSEPRLAFRCSTTGVAHRFKIPVNGTNFSAHSGEKIYAHAIGPNANGPLDQSSLFSVP